MTTATPLLFGHDASAGEVLRTGWPIPLSLSRMRGQGIIQPLLTAAGRKPGVRRGFFKSTRPSDIFARQKAVLTASGFKTTVGPKSPLQRCPCSPESLGIRVSGSLGYSVEVLG